MDPDEFVLTATEERLRALQEAIDFMSSRVEAPLRRRLITRPAGGGALHAYVVTEFAETGGQQITYEGTVSAKPLKESTEDAEPTDDDDTLAVGMYSSSMCIAKGNIVFATKLLSSAVKDVVGASIDGVIVSGGIGTRFEGECYEDIDIDNTGRVTVTYPDHFETSRQGTLVAYNLSGFSLASGQRVIVDLSTVNHAGLNNITRFIVTALLDCP